MPIEAHGGKNYSDLCIRFATDLLCSGYSSIIFPEGAYVEGGTIYRGRTGATRILYNSRELGVVSNLLPVAIDVDKSNVDLDSYSIDEGHVSITFLSPIDYSDYYYRYISSDKKYEKNEMLHKPIDMSLSSIASVLKRKYCNEYIELYPKKNVIFENGETIPTDIEQDNYYISLYTSQLEKRKEKILFKSR